MSAILNACSRLHNFIIQEDGPFDRQYNNVDEEIESLHIQPNAKAPLGMSYLPVVPDETFETYTGISYTRQLIVDNLRAHEIYRPLNSIERKKKEQQFVISPNGVANEREFISPV